MKILNWLMPGILILLTIAGLLSKDFNAPIIRLANAAQSKTDPCETFYGQAKESFVQSGNSKTFTKSNYELNRSIAASLLYQNCRVRQGK